MKGLNTLPLMLAADELANVIRLTASHAATVSQCAAPSGEHDLLRWTRSVQQAFRDGDILCEALAVIIRKTTEQARE